MYTFSRWLQAFAVIVLTTVFLIPAIHALPFVFYLITSSATEVLAVLCPSGWALLLAGSHLGVYRYYVSRRPRVQQKARPPAATPSAAIYRTSPSAAPRLAATVVDAVPSEGRFVLVLVGVVASIFVSGHVVRVSETSLPWSVLLHDPSIVAGVPMMLAMWVITWLDYEARKKSPRTLTSPVALAVVGVGLSLGAIALGAVPLDAWLGQSYEQALVPSASGAQPDARGPAVALNAGKPPLPLSSPVLAVWLGAYAFLVVALGLHALLVLRARRTAPPPPST